MKLNDPTMLVERSHVGGWWGGEPVDPVSNPATGELLARVPRFGGAEARAAVARAEQTLATWLRRTAKGRSVVLRRWFDLILANKEDLGLIMTGEQGKGRGEVEYAATVKKEERELGGVKQSGTGRDGSWHGMGEFTAFKDMLLAGLDR